MVSSSDSRANQRGREPTTEVTGAVAQFVPAMVTVTEVVVKSFIFYYPKGKEREDRSLLPTFWNKIFFNCL